jgi:hypothetical protein
MNTTSPALLLFLSFLILSCSYRANQNNAAAPPSKNAYSGAQGLIKEGALLLKDGDLLLRSGQEYSSQMISRFSRNDKTYSHAGLVFIENGLPVVYHILPGDENPDEKLRTDSLNAFLNPRRNFGFAIYRYRLDSNQVNRLKDIIHQWYRQGVYFDYEFNLKTSDRMYCSEMIRKALMLSSGNQIVLNTTKPTDTEAATFSKYTKVPAFKVVHNDIVAIDNLFLHPECRLIKRFDFTKP